MLDKFKKKSKMIAKVVSTLKDDDSSKRNETNDTVEKEAKEKSKSISSSSEDSRSSPESLSSRYAMPNVLSFQYYLFHIILSSIIHVKRRKSSEDNKDIPRHMRQVKEKNYKATDDPDLKELEKNIAARLGSLFTEKAEKKMSSSHNEDEGLMFDVGQQDKRMASALKR